MVVAVVESDGFYLALLRGPAQTALEVGAVLGILLPHGSWRGKPSVRTSDERERGKQFDVETNAWQPRVCAVGRLLAHLATTARIDLGIVFLQQRNGFVARTCRESEHALHPFQEGIARPSVGRGDGIGLTARKSRQKERHALIDHAIAVILLEAVFVIFMVADADFSREDAIPQGHFPFALGLNTTRMIQAMVGAHHHGLTIVGLCTSHQVKGFTQKVGLG